ncbi:dynactin subunit 2 [Mariniradius sediminis]|uniref:Dynactin subunit 2 n=1 Tax=Mariniradius sediminis TaxID=2909237 RepID=A0ABS9BYQ1_9BACT|nr:dynactin subunit 2 [Mariniradius sediminis]MCF1753175.1 dynactin subunit 2 [Mariniradius sediminis]
MENLKGFLTIIVLLFGISFLIYIIDVNEVWDIAISIAIAFSIFLAFSFHMRYTDRKREIEDLQRKLDSAENRLKSMRMKLRQIKKTSTRRKADDLSIKEIFDRIEEMERYMENFGK